MRLGQSSYGLLALPQEDLPEWFIGMALLLLYFVCVCTHVCVYCVCVRVRVTEDYFSTEQR